MVIQGLGTLGSLDVQDVGAGFAQFKIKVISAAVNGEDNISCLDTFAAQGSGIMSCHCSFTNGADPPGFAGIAVR